MVCGRRASEVRRAGLSWARSITSDERKILSFDETARVLRRLEEPYKLIIEICIATGARISEVLGLKWRHVNLDAGTIKIEQRVWQQDIGRPKSEDSRTGLGIGDLAEPLRERPMKTEQQRIRSCSNKDEHRADLSGTPVFAMPFIRQPKPKDAISPA